jgi:hypothetical protein
VPNFIDPDDDGDGMPDAWELLYGLNPTNAADAVLSADGDPASNLEEYVADTDPTDPISYLRFLTIEGVPPTFTFLSSTGRIYTIQVNGDLAGSDWLPLPSLIGFQGVGGPDLRTDPFPGEYRNYRIFVHPPE